MSTRQALHCGACLYWRRGNQAVLVDGVDTGRTEPATWGDCHRYAPRGAVVVPEGAATGCISGEIVPFPGTNEDDWCGEFVSISGSGWRMPTEPEDGPF